MKQQNTPAMGALATTQHLKHHWVHQMIDAKSDFKYPSNKRTPPTEVNGSGAHNQRAPAGYYDRLKNAEINKTPNSAVESVKGFFQGSLGINDDLQLSQHDSFLLTLASTFPAWKPSGTMSA